MSTELQDAPACPLKGLAELNTDLATIKEKLTELKTALTKDKKKLEDINAAYAVILPIKDNIIAQKSQNRVIGYHAKTAKAFELTEAQKRAWQNLAAKQDSFIQSSPIYQFIEYSIRLLITNDQTSPDTVMEPLIHHIKKIEAEIIDQRKRIHYTALNIENLELLEQKLLIEIKKREEVPNFYTVPAKVQEQQVPTIIFAPTPSTIGKKAGAGLGIVVGAGIGIALGSAWAALTVPACAITGTLIGHKADKIFTTRANNRIFSPKTPPKPKTETSTRAVARTLNLDPERLITKIIVPAKPNPALPPSPSISQEEPETPPPEYRAPSI